MFVFAGSSAGSFLRFSVLSVWFVAQYGRCLVVRWLWVIKARRPPPAGQAAARRYLLPAASSHLPCIARTLRHGGTSMPCAAKDSAARDTRKRTSTRRSDA